MHALKALLATMLMAMMIVPAIGQDVGQAFTFSDTSLTPSDLDVYQITNGSMVRVPTINSSYGHIQYDPTSDYLIVFHPTLQNTVLTNPEGLIGYFINNPEIAAIILVVIIVLAVCLGTVGLVLLFMLLRRK
jgi:hypothetical protein